MWERELEGKWLIKGTTFPLWLTPKRKFPRITYRLLNKNPLKLLDLVTYEKNGKTKMIRGIDEYKHPEFVWRGVGLLKVLSSRWQVVTLKGDVLVIRFEKSLVTPAGVDLLIRSGAKIPRLRERVMENYESFGLTLEERNALEWK